MVSYIKGYKTRNNNCYSLAHSRNPHTCDRHVDPTEKTTQPALRGNLASGFSEAVPSFSPNVEIQPYMTCPIIHALTHTNYLVSLTHLIDNVMLLPR